ncbi:MAG: hypothetical protein ACR2KL_09490 [Nocardioidaceae bacterium]
MPFLHIVDETFVVASAAVVRTRWCRESEWTRVLPGLRLECYEDRGALGKRWRMAGRLSGTAEVWLQQFADGVLVHVYLRAQRPVGRDRLRSRRRLRRDYALRLKRWGFSIKDAAEGRRPAGEPRRAVGCGDARPDDQ